MKDLATLLKGMATIAELHTPIFSVKDMAMILQTSNTKAVSVLVHRACKKKLLEKVTNGFYISTLNPPKPILAIYDIAQKMRSQYITYVSLESQLSYTGYISQIPMERLTVMTTGRKGTFQTTYGTIEFTHTHRKPGNIAKDLYFDKEYKIWRAKPIRAYFDLKAVNRNLNMVVGF